MRSALLPQAGFDADDAATRYNTKAVLGVQPAILPHDVGPFQAVHIGPTFSAPLFDLTLIRRYQASGHHLLASRADVQTVREETVLLAVSGYMANLRARASVTAAQSRVDLADRLARQAQDLLADGVASKIDVSRAQVRLSEEQQRLVDDQRDAEMTLNALKRLLNMTDAEQIEFTDQQDFFSTPSLEFSDPLSIALQQRPELHALSESAKAAELAHKAAGAESLPKLNVDGHWNEQGQTFNTMTPGYDYRANVRFTDNYGWPFIFYMNVIPAAVTIRNGMSFTMEDQVLKKLNLLKHGERPVESGLMAIGLAAFEIVLEDGKS